jgi:hypothetical protein
VLKNEIFFGRKRYFVLQTLAVVGGQVGGTGGGGRLAEPEPGRKGGRKRQLHSSSLDTRPSEQEIWSTSDTGRSGRGYRGRTGLGGKRHHTDKIFY